MTTPLPKPSTTLTTLRKIAENGSTIEVGRFSVRSDGELEVTQPELPLLFRFRWRGAGFAGRIEESAGSIMLYLATDLSALPFTAEDPVARRVILDNMIRSGRQPGGQLEVNERNQLVLSNIIELPKPHCLTVKKIVSNIAVLALLARPFLDFFQGLSEHPQPLAH